ncbi:SMI1/KNR4 family protein [Actinoallomurus sp. NBC_01490]|uniref:SMI1/KNR4 family protein n=1 Tax=Actinoallomurus sp. NBC_01490 TaxID=2903557 RepID=UPI002E31BB28|nr:SMI1/KNR4 family protein [Actinoallomurus sp. NBC_01490]
MSEDDLIARLRRRAYDPARRQDDVYVPCEWIRQRYGDEVKRKIRKRAGSDAELKAGAPEAVEYFKDAPHEPPYPPVTVPELLAAERQMGRQLPDLLRRLYTEVANGGFGPTYGILGIIRSGQHDERDIVAVDEYLARPELNDPLGFPLVQGGCSVWWYVSLTQPGNPVYLFDGDGWDRPEQDPPTVAVEQTWPSLAEWLGQWADGYDVWSGYSSIARSAEVG